jgi:hypothetical protein
MKKAPKKATVVITSPTRSLVFSDDFEIPPRSTLRQIREKGEEVALELVEKVLSVPENRLEHEGPVQGWTFEIKLGSKRPVNVPSTYTF